MKDNNNTKENWIKYYKRCDSSEKLIDNALLSISNKNIDILFILGDILPHDVKLIN